MEELYKYSKVIRQTDEIVRSVFSGLQIITATGTAFDVPTIWGNAEKAVQYMLQEVVQDDAGEVVDRIRLPIVAFQHDRLNPHYDDGDEADRLPADPKPFSIKYSAQSFSMYVEDANQIAEQILSKLPQPAYFDQPNGWQTKVSLNNVDFNGERKESADAKIKVIKYQYVLYAEVNARKKDS